MCEHWLLQSPDFLTTFIARNDGSPNCKETHFIYNLKLILAKKFWNFAFYYVNAACQMSIQPCQLFIWLILMIAESSWNHRFRILFLAIFSRGQVKFQFFFAKTSSYKCNGLQVINAMDLIIFHQNLISRIKDIRDVPKIEHVQYLWNDMFKSLQNFAKLASL